MRPAERFAEFHRRNPEVWSLFVQFAFEAMRAGRTKFSSKAIINRIRWEKGVTDKVDKFKINDLLTPFYGRLFDQQYPEHRGFFSHRSSVADMAYS